jgi:tryptophanyl-tRNA synthetase
MIIPGTDGRKMSKSYNNYISVFASEKEIKKQIMGILTDSKGLEEPKNPMDCNVFQLYKLMASENQIKKLELKYKNGGYGYGHAKMDLYNLILENFKEPRKKFEQLVTNPDLINSELKKGADKANKVANSVLNKVKKNLGLMRT